MDAVPGPAGVLPEPGSSSPARVAMPAWRGLAFATAVSLFLAKPAGLPALCARCLCRACLQQLRRPRDAQ